MCLAVILDVCLSVVKMCQTGLDSPNSRVSNIQYITDLSLSLSLCFFSLYAPLHLSCTAAVSSFHYLWLQMQPRSGGTSCSTLPPFLSASMTHFSYALASALNFSCFAPSSLSVYHVFLALLFFSSLNLYWLPSHLLLLYSIFLSPFPSVFCLLASRAPGLKHAVIHWIGSCVQVWVCACAYACFLHAFVFWIKLVRYYRVNISSVLYATSASILYKASQTV